MTYVLIPNKTTYFPQYIGPFAHPSKYWIWQYQQQGYIVKISKWHVDNTTPIMHFNVAVKKDMTPETSPHYVIRNNFHVIFKRKGNKYCFYILSKWNKKHICKRTYLEARQLTAEVLHDIILKKTRVNFPYFTYHITGVVSKLPIYDKYGNLTYNRKNE